MLVLSGNITRTAYSTASYCFSSQEGVRPCYFIAVYLLVLAAGPHLPWIVTTPFVRVLVAHHLHLCFDAIVLKILIFSTPHVFRTASVARIVSAERD
jgi:hypothetical protein